MKCDITIRVYTKGDQESPFVDIPLGKKLDPSFLTIAELIKNSNQFGEGEVTISKEDFLDKLKTASGHSIDLDAIRAKKGDCIIFTHTLDELISQYGLMGLEGAKDIKVLVTKGANSSFSNSIFTNGEEEIYVVRDGQKYVDSLIKFIRKRRLTGLRLRDTSDTTITSSSDKAVKAFNSWKSKLQKSVNEQLKKVFQTQKDEDILSLNFKEGYDLIAKLQEKANQLENIRKKLTAEKTAIEGKIAELKSNEGEKDAGIEEQIRVREKELELKNQALKNIASEVTINRLIPQLQFYYNTDIHDIASLYDAYLTYKKVFDLPGFKSINNALQEVDNLFSNRYNKEDEYTDLFTKNILSKATFKQRASKSQTVYTLSLSSIKDGLDSTIELMQEDADLQKSLPAEYNIDDLKTLSDHLSTILSRKKKDVSQEDKDKLQVAIKEVKNALPSIIGGANREIDYKILEEDNDNGSGYNFKTKQPHITLYTNSGTLEERYHTTQIPTQCTGEGTVGGYNIYSVNFNGKDWYFTCKGNYTKSTIVRLKSSLDAVRRDRTFIVQRQSTKDYNFDLNLSESGCVVERSKTLHTVGSIVKCLKYTPEKKALESLQNPTHPLHTFLFGDVTYSDAINTILTSGTIVSGVTYDNISDISARLRNVASDVENLKILCCELALSHDNDQQQNTSFPIKVDEFKTRLDDIAKKINNLAIKAFTVIDSEYTADSNKENVDVRTIYSELTPKKKTDSDEEVNTFSAFDQFKDSMQDLGVTVVLETEVPEGYSKNAKAWIQNGEVHINTTRASIKDGFHEYCHLLLGYFKYQVENAVDQDGNKIFEDGYYENFLAKFATLNGVHQLMDEKEKLYPNRTRFDILEEIFCDKFGEMILKRPGTVDSIDALIESVAAGFARNSQTGAIINSEQAKLFKYGLQKITENFKGESPLSFINNFTRQLNDEYGSVPFKTIDQSIIDIIKKDRQARNAISNLLDSKDAGNKIIENCQ